MAIQKGNAVCPKGLGVLEMKPVSLVSVFQDIAMMQCLLLIPAFAQITESLKHANFVNYGDLVKEIYSDPYLSADRELLVANDNSKNENVSKLFLDHVGKERLSVDVDDCKIDFDKFFNEFI